MALLKNRVDKIHHQHKSLTEPSIYCLINIYIKVNALLKVDFPYIYGYYYEHLILCKCLFRKKLVPIAIRNFLLTKQTYNYSGYLSTYECYTNCNDNT
jgi:hypothetical protein